MDYSKLNNVSTEEIDLVLNQNADMLNSVKGKFTNNILSLSNLFVLPFVPFMLTFASFYQFDTWYGKLLATIFSNIIILPIAAIASAINIVRGVVSIPLALLFEGIPSLFSKTYRKEYKLSRCVKKLAKIYKGTDNIFNNYSEKFSFNSPNVRNLISEINILNKQLERNLSNYATTYTVHDFKNNKTHNTNNITDNYNEIDIDYSKNDNENEF